MNAEERQRLKRIMEFTAGLAVTVCLIVLIFFRTEIFTKGLSRAVGILTPFVYGAVIAYLLHPACSVLERWLLRAEKRICKKEHPGLRRMLSILLVLAAFFAILIVLLMTVLPELINSISGLVAQLPGALERFQAWIAGLDNGEASHGAVVYIEQMVETLTQRLENFLQTDLLPEMMNLVSSVTLSFVGILSVLKNFGLGCIIAAYFLGGWEKFVAQAKLIVYGVFPTHIADWIKKEILFADRMFSGFIHGKLVDSLIVGLICFVFCALTNMPYAVLVSVIVGVTNIIPFFGPYLGAIPSVLLILTVSPMMSIVFLVFVIILQQFDGNVLGPKILGDELGLSGFWILFAILVAGDLWGLVGMLVGVPLFAVIYDLIRSFIMKRLKQRGQETMIQNYEDVHHSPEPEKQAKPAKRPRKGKKRS